jgi:NADP-dependent 3-hydroxy acid dehydrogenase YdfG
LEKTNPTFFYAKRDIPSDERKRTASSFPVAKAFVTGGSGGLGAVIAKALAENGADVALSYSGNRDAAELVARNQRSLRDIIYLL